MSSRSTHVPAIVAAATLGFLTAFAGQPQSIALGTERVALVVPGRYAGVDDADGSSGILGTAMRMQNLYSASHFRGMPVVIHEIRYRREQGVAPFAPSRLDVQLKLSTTSRQPGGLDPSFDENHGLDALVVLDGAVTIESSAVAPPGGVPAFDIVLPLQTPFTYDPARGNLLYEIRTRGPAGAVVVDATNDSDLGVSRAFALDASAAEAAYRDTAADILQFVVSTVPAPVTNLVTNGDFELPMVSGATWEWLSPGSGVLAGWTVGGEEGSGVDLVRELWQPGHGDQSLDLAGWGPGWISQLLATVPGRCYDVSFLVAGNVVDEPALKAGEVYWAGRSIGQVTFDSTGKTLTDMGWESRSFRHLVAGTTVTELRFVSANTGRAGLVLDDVQVVPAACQASESQWVTLPPRFADIDDPDGSSGVLGAGMRLQNVYAAAHFTGGPITIREIRHRRDAGTEPFTARELDLQITLSTTSRQPDHLSATFEENLGPDPQVVLDGRVTVSSPSLPVPGGPQPFDIIFPLSTPFIYDPAAGNLLYEIRTRNPAGALWTDASNDADDGASRCFANWASAPTATYLDTGADIILLVGELEVAPLRLEPAGGYFKDSVEVTLRTPLEDAAIHYTTDGTEPTTASTRYTAPLQLTQSATLKARVFLDGAPASEIVSATYLEDVWNDGIPVAWRAQYFGADWFTKTVAGPLADADEDGANTYQEFLALTDPTNGQSVPDPVPALLVVTPASGTYAGEVAVSFTTPIPGGAIRFTRDGAEPGADSEAYPGEPVTLLASATLKARVYIHGNPVSGLVEAPYVLTPVAPTLVHHPVGATVYEGEAYTFQVAAKGTPPLTYRWFRDGSEIAGASGQELAFAAVTFADAGAYTVQVANAHGAATSEPAVLTVVPRPMPPVIVQQPQSQTVAVGGTAVFAVEATGSEPLTYQWRYSVAPLPGETGPVLRLSNVQKSQAGFYSVLVRNAHGSRGSAHAVLTVVDAPIAPRVTSGPLSIVQREGEAASLAVTVAGTSPFAYEWRHNGQVLPGAHTARLNWSALALTDAGTYAVTVSNEAGSVTSAPVIIEVRPLAPGGTVVLDNRVMDALDAPVLDVDGVTRLAGPAFFAQLHAGADAGVLVPVGPVVPFLPGGGAGFVQRGQGGNVVTLPMIAPGGTAHVQVRAWESERGPSYEQAYRAGGKTGRSTVLTLVTGGAGEPASPPAQLVGIQSFRLERDAEPPVVTVSSPPAGTTPDERFSLTGQVTDAIALGEVRWEWNGANQGPLSLDGQGRFHVAGQRLLPGDNHLRIHATDAAGNASLAVVVAVWEPVRVLEWDAADPVREGRRAKAQLAFRSPGEVSGLTFVVRYDPEQFRDPAFSWAPGVLLAGALAQVSTETAGEVRATLSLPGAVLPAGRQPLATLTLRARSVPGLTVARLESQVLDVADRVGAPLTFGNLGRTLTLEIQPRQLVGDANGNGALEVGDATLIQRLIARLDLPQAWDVVLNDLNQNFDLDSGDVVKILRVLVGLDPAPAPGRLARLAGFMAPAQIRMESVAIAGPASNARLNLTASMAVVWPGASLVVRVNLAEAPLTTSGVAFTLNYPANALRLAGEDGYRTGEAVPTGVVALWNHDEAAGRLSFAAAGAQVWPATAGTLAEVTFERLAQPAGDALLVTLDPAQLALEGGFEVDSLPAASVILTDHLPRIDAAVTRTDDGWEITFDTADGAGYRLEASSDLVVWETISTHRGQGGRLRVTDPDTMWYAQRFYRLRLVP
ncbi:MAG: choice-of-anchor C family protein [Verrucomicrobiales bacterium]|nr:choice-of-anchor C family protein [Verrucomicrobiales bacterium]